MSKTHFAVAAAAVGGDSDHAAGNGVSSSGAGAIKWCCCQCISATGAGGAAGVGTDVVLHTAMQTTPKVHTDGHGASEINVIFFSLYRFTVLPHFATTQLILQHVSN